VERGGIERLRVVAIGDKRDVASAKGRRREQRRREGGSRGGGRG
jgi:hypothetical protein